MLSKKTVGLGTYFYPVNTLSNKKRAMRCRTRKPRSLKVRSYAVILLTLTSTWIFFPGAKISDIIFVTEINGILLNSMPKQLDQSGIGAGI